MAKTVAVEKIHETPLTETQFDNCAEEEQNEFNDAGQPLIYMVRAYHLEGYVGCVYEGRVKGSRESEFLSTQWLNDNHMNRTWRQRTILSRQCYWFRVAVLRNQSDRATLSMCTLGSAAKVLAYMGLSKKRHQLLSRFDNVYKAPYSATVRAIRGLKGFAVTRMKSPANFDTVRGVHPGCMYLLQVRSKHIHTGETDNTHAFCIFNELIFDVNRPGPLPLTSDNLDLCCVGSKWKYDQAVRIVKFTPTHKVSHYVQQHINS